MPLLTTRSSRSYGFGSSIISLPNSYESISTVILTSSSPSVTFNSIPGTYKHLQIRTKTRHVGATVGGQSQMRVNGDTGVSYTYHTLYGNGAGGIPQGDGATGYSWAYGIERYTAANDLSNTFGSAIIDFLDYSNTSKFKSIRAFGGYDSNGSGQIRIHSGMWMNTSTITSILFENQGGADFAAGTVMALYGIKG